MKIKPIDGEFSVCKLSSLENVAITEPFTFLSVTDCEISLVCPAVTVPSNATHIENGWRMLRIEGELDFSLVGILADISRILACENIGIFAISTYNTDYILCKKENFEGALKTLNSNGYD